ncbi:MAG: transporter substrate-binding domain-containing protein [Spirochaetaceae bacterium]|jgi:putative glutamine transport system substrate-binding protein|nr:transporter substrate-binding domain-containing protein [Spirochaetaceae bacterium]
MKLMGKMLGAALAALLAGAVLAGCGNAQGEQDVAAIKKAGVLKVGVKADVPGFGLQNTVTGQYEGFEIELAKLIAQDILGDPSKAAFTAVTAKTRGPLIDTGELDMIIATFTITDERKLTYNFTTPYYTDAVGMLVKKSAGIGGLIDLDGKTIGVAQSATSKVAIEAAAFALRGEDMGVSPKFAEFATYPEIKAALDSGRVDVFSVDKSILSGYLDDETVILPDAFAPQPYGVTTKLQNKALAAYLDGLIVKWLADGTIDRLARQFNLL